MDSRRQLGAFAVVALVLLRVVTGWHFFSEGLQKIDRDPATGEYRITFSAAAFLSAAKGPFADYFQSMAPNGHDWQTLLAVPHQNKMGSPEDAKTASERDPARAWADHIAEAWQSILDQATAIPGLAEAQVQQAKAAFARRKKELLDYLASEKAAIAKYQHELWRLENWRAKPEAADLPFEKERITKKASETSSQARAWAAGVAELEATYLADLREILSPEQRAETATTSAVENATTGTREAKLQRVNLAATVLTIGVGICLLLGLFTRLAAVAGALFLLSVIATQPPWLSTAEPTYYQSVELAGLLVLAATGTGRWLGLDYFSWALFGKKSE